MIARCPGPVAAEQAQIISPCIMTKHLHFGFICPKDIVPEVLCFVQMLIVKSKPRCHVLFRDKSLSPATVPNKPYLFSLSLDVLVNFNIYHADKVCRLWVLALGKNMLGWEMYNCLEWFSLVSNLSLCRMMHLAAIYPLHSYGSSEGGLSFHTLLLHFGLVLTWQSTFLILYKQIRFQANYRSKMVL